MNLLYLAALLVSIAGMVVLDARFRLFLWRSPGTALVTLAIGVGMLLVADAIGIALGVFGIGDTPYLSGIVLAPHLPLEEPFFLLFLCQLTMVVHELVRRIRAPRRTEG
ncbi:lycopene cyclase domain-containing protein [Protaetiibacter mangrovi]|uniref:Lycopene cyclase domain-containing protein n=1 Tax=Protaetiibacter mangrovi TaxID=2970926 RepID=A0ABT1ZI72_9MICO|nr:lycopene cyclase domain-containing protein [Protaetiibacter mangrovi]MCS0500397.1 lycopene cyclase domain-containing protein [Protaetiibacter mangrovi]TPX05069.1 lycopene cyclase domain-containing protein [Schumannella luteola]